MTELGTSNSETAGYVYKTLAETLAEKDTADESGSTAKEVLAAIAAKQAVAAEAFAGYKATLKELGEAAKGLTNKELVISGTLHGRGGTIVYPDDPKAQVEDLSVRVGHARVEIPLFGEFSPPVRDPFVVIDAWTTNGRDELVVAELHSEGVSALSREEWEAQQIQA